MADLITVEDPDDPRLRDYTGLTDVELRRKREPAEGLFIAEGEKVIRRAKEAGYEMRSMLLSAKWIDVMRDVIDELPAPVYAVSPALAEQVTGYHVHRGALASMQRKPLPTADELLRSARRVVVMESVNDHTNIGAIFRSAAALGMDAVLLSPDCADPLYRRSVRVSMGTVLQVPWTRLPEWDDAVPLLHDAGFDIAALALSDDAVTLDAYAADPPGRVAMVFGAEGDGLSRRALAAADTVVTIPMLHGVDSLNVASASAVALWALRARSQRSPGE